MPTALITGVSGQDGAFLSNLLLDKGYQVAGTLRHNSQVGTSRLKILGIADRIRFVELDLGDRNGINELFLKNKFDEVYNLAAQSFVGSPWDNPVDVSDINGLGVVRLLDAIRSYSPETKYYQAATSEMFGKATIVPQNEDTAFHPRSAYGVSKTYGHFITQNYRESLSLHASSGIAFNHESPLRGKEFVTRKITLGLARFARGCRVAVELGNLDAQRDWGYAGDYVDGMWRMLQQDRPSDYVLATGVSTSVRDFVNIAATALGLSLDWSGSGELERAVDRKSGAVVVKVNPNFYRPVELCQLIGDATKARIELGWEAKVSVHELAAFMARSDYDMWTKS